MRNKSLSLSLSNQREGKSLVVRSILMSTWFDSEMSTRQIILVRSKLSFLFWIKVLKPGILKSSSPFTAFVSVSTRKITLMPFDLISSFNSCSLIISPRRIFQLQMMMVLLLVCVLFESWFVVPLTGVSIGFESVSIEVGWPTGSVFVCLVGALLD